MSGENSAVFGIYSTHVGADAAVDRLKTSGFRSTDVSVLFPPWRPSPIPAEPSPVRAARSLDWALPIIRASGTNGE